jgi:hypothetical protein
MEKEQEAKRARCEEITRMFQSGEIPSLTDQECMDVLGFVQLMTREAMDALEACTDIESEEGKKAMFAVGSNAAFLMKFGFMELFPKLLEASGRRSADFSRAGQKPRKEW